MKTNSSNPQEIFNYAEVLIDSFSGSEDKTFTYLIPEQLKKEIRLGTPVIVPFGENQIGGYVVGLNNECRLENITVKEIISASSEQIISQEYLEFLRWSADYFFTSFISMLKAAIPSGILTKARKVVRILEIEQFTDFCQLLPKGNFADFCAYIREKEEVKFSTLKSVFGFSATRFIRKLINQGLIQIDLIFEKKLKSRKQLFVSFLHSDGDLNKREKEVISFLQKYPALTLQEAIEQGKTTTVFLRKLAEKGYINISTEIIRRTPHKKTPEEIVENPLKLNNYQQNAVDYFEKVLVQDNRHQVLLLHGVTGSGKTEVYLQTIGKIIAEGKSAIVLVPEISLTPQTVNRFRRRFGDCVAVLHSALSEGERFDEWFRIKHGLARIIIGARSAIFAPCDNLGLIIIDEEHESSYKQDRNPRYNAKTIALKRAEINNAPVILGSATPAIESYYQAQNNPSWKLLEIPERVEKKELPEVLIVDMRQEFLEGNRSLFSRKLEKALRERFEKKEQCIVFINRRGYSPFVLCRDCGHCLKCKNCSVSMVYHVTEEFLKCHYCGESISLPQFCPVCKGRNVRHFGVGTQKIEAVVKKIFPEIKVARLDRDTTGKKDAHFEILEKFSQGEFDLLIGTQMVAKGLDYPNVTLVGIMAADSAINIPDFRASERTFQLLTQVAGRSGRGEKKGIVLAQTYDTNHVAIETAQKHDFSAYYQTEIREREEVIYPPFCQLINLIIANPDEKMAKEDAGKIALFLREQKNEDLLKILGPVPAGIPKIKSFYRQQILLKVKSLENVRIMLKEGIRTTVISSGTKIGVDIEPLNLI